jgi:hypothetical protein
MNAGSQDFSVFEAISGMIVFVSFIAFGSLMATLRSHVDEAKIRKEESVSRVFRSPIPPEHVLTATGRQRVKAAKIALGVFMITVAIIVVRNQILTR